jgi:hypothetical protein
LDSKSPEIFQPIETFVHIRGLIVHVLVRFHYSPTCHMPRHASVTLSLSPSSLILHPSSFALILLLAGFRISKRKQLKHKDLRRLTGSQKILNQFSHTTL